MREWTIEIGQVISDSEGTYEITGFYEKGGTICTVRECIYDDDGNYIALGDERWLTKSEVKACYRYETGKNLDKVICKVD